MDSTSDRIIGCAIVIISFTGLLGNISSFLYFWCRRHKSIPDKLYLGIVSVDICTTITAIPVIVSLFNNRNETLFQDEHVCAVWAILANLTVRMSMFMVTVLSVSRTVAIILPYKARYVRENMVIAVVAGYGILLFTVDGVGFAVGWMKGTFQEQLPFCSFNFTERTPEWAKLFFLIALQVELFLPSLIIFISFLAGTLSLMRKSTALTLINNHEKRFRNVSITITLFTALFMLSNTPVFAYQMLILLSYRLESAQLIVSGDVISFYGHLLLLYLPVLLNAALNPCLYLFRMPSYKDKFSKFFNWNRRAVKRATAPLMLSERLTCPERSKESVPLKAG